MPGSRDHSPIQRRTIDIVGATRDYSLCLPDSGESPWPTVLAFHGAGSNAEGMIAFTRLDQVARQCGFAAVFPQGTGRVPEARSWNAGASNVYAARKNMDDQGFVSALLDRLLAEGIADPRRLYAAGMSNGGLLCYALASALPGRFAAIGPVGCSMVNPLWPAVPTPLIHLHGTADRFVPYQGGVGDHSFTRHQFLPVERVVRDWAQSNGCRLEPRVKLLPTRVNDGTQIERTEYPGDHPVCLYTIQGGGHTWPGQSSPYGFLGKTTANLDANVAIWDFFSSQARP